MITDLISPEWLQALAAFLTLVVIIVFGVTSYRVQRNMADREKASTEREAAFAVKPDFAYSTARIGPSESNVEDTAWIHVTNIGHGAAYDIIFSTQLSTWNGRSVHYDPIDKLLLGQTEVFDTKIKITDLRHESGGTFKIVIWGVMKDGDGREVLIRKERVSYKVQLDSHPPGTSSS